MSNTAAPSRLSVRTLRKSRRITLLRHIVFRETTARLRGGLPLRPARQEIVVGQSFVMVSVTAARQRGRIDAYRVAFDELPLDVVLQRQTAPRSPATDTGIGTPALAMLKPPFCSPLYPSAGSAMANLRGGSYASVGTDIPSSG